MTKKKIKDEMPGAEFRAWIAGEGLSTQVFANTVGVSHGTVNAWRRGAKPSPMAIEKIAAKYPECVLLNVMA